MTRKEAQTYLAVFFLVSVVGVGMYELGARSERVHTTIHETVATSNGYAVLYTFEGKPYSVAFRLRPWSYPAYRVDCWVVEGHDPSYADALLGDLDDEVLVSGAEASEYWQRRRWNKEVK